jgi:hypothetical protein
VKTGILVFYLDSIIAFRRIEGISLGIGHLLGHGDGMSPFQDVEFLAGGLIARRLTISHKITPDHGPQLQPYFTGIFFLDNFNMSRAKYATATSITLAIHGEESSRPRLLSAP